MIDNATQTYPKGLFFEIKDSGDSIKGHLLMCLPYEQKESPLNAFQNEKISQAFENAKYVLTSESMTRKRSKIKAYFRALSHPITVFQGVALLMDVGVSPITDPTFTKAAKEKRKEVISCDPNFNKVNFEKLKNINFDKFENEKMLKQEKENLDNLIQFWKNGDYENYLSLRKEYNKNNPVPVYIAAQTDKAAKKVIKMIDKSLRRHDNNFLSFNDLFIYEGKIIEGLKEKGWKITQIK